MSDKIRITDHHSAAEWVRAHNGSCTSPMAVELGMEDAWRVMTITGPVEPRTGDFLVATKGGIAHVNATGCGFKGCDQRGTERVEMPESWYLMCRQHADDYVATTQAAIAEHEAQAADYREAAESRYMQEAGRPMMRRAAAQEDADAEALRAQLAAGTVTA